jgi:tol-pal system protein YbgF
MFSVMVRVGFRPLILPATAIAAVLLVARPAPSLGQGFFGSDRSTQERLDRVERDLNMLQRQVYRGAPGPMVGGDAGGAVNAEIRLNRIEEQMRELNGRFEEVANQVERLKQRMEQINSDVDVRLGQGAGGPGPNSMGPTALGPAMAPPHGPGSRARPLPDQSSGANLNPQPPRGSMPPAPVFGTLTPPGAPPAGPPSAGDMAGAGEGVAAGPGRSLPGGSATDQYNHAFGLVKQANYQAAEGALRSFVEQHPNDPMAGNAQYWLGETLYARSKFMEAASAFAEGYKRYPKNVKAPDALLKLGMALGRANQKQNACVALAQLDHDFPHAAANVKQQAGAEKKRLGC